MNEHQKIIFLDINGVLSTMRCKYNEMDPIALNNLKKIIQSTNAKVVITSTWKTGDIEETKKLFPSWLQDHIIGETMNLRGMYDFHVSRGNEIQTWIKQNIDYPIYDLIRLYRNNKQPIPKSLFTPKYSYVIIDDNDDMLFTQRNNFVQTNYKIGISDSDASMAISILNK